jgi:hypothetical protein
MNRIQKLAKEVSIARQRYLEQIAMLTDFQSQWKSEEAVWNITEITEHLFWAEQGGIFGMWKTLYAIRNGDRIRTYESNHKDMSIEQIIDITWQPKEKVPEVASPRLGGPLSFWTASFNSLQGVLDSFGQDLQEDELRMLAQPHPISGALDFHQRFEFLRFHIDRHREQVLLLLTNMNS